MSLAFAMEVPETETIQNLNGVQQCIRVYTVPGDADPEALAGEDFTYEGYIYSYSSMTKKDNWLEAEKAFSREMSFETEKGDLGSVLAALPVSIEFDEDGFKGTLYLDHSTIETKASGYKTSSYKVSDTREFENLESNDMSYVPMAVTKDGKTLGLTGIQWDVQATALVDDVLVPAMYKATAYYSGSASCSKATGYVTTAQYVGNAAKKALDSVTYTVTYTGSEEDPDGPFKLGNGKIGIGLVAIIVLFAIMVLMYSAVVVSGRAEKKASSIKMTELDGSDLPDPLEDRKQEDEECEQKYY